jgi:hypothetical protein
MSIKIIKIFTWMIAFVCAGATNTCLLNESREHRMTPINDVQIKNITNTTFLPSFQFKTCDVCSPIQVTRYSFRQLPEFTFSFGTDNPDTALLNQYRP